jgi:hypothetical protein
MWLPFLRLFGTDSNAFCHAIFGLGNILPTNQGMKCIVATPEQRLAVGTAHSM